MFILDIMSRRWSGKIIDLHLEYRRTRVDQACNRRISAELCDPELL